MCKIRPIKLTKWLLIFFNFSCVCVGGVCVGGGGWGGGCRVRGRVSTHDLFYPDEPNRRISY